MMKTDMTWGWLLGLMLVVVGWGCGGGAAPEPAPVAPVVGEEAPPPPPVRQVDTRMWHVFWEELHILTVYPEGGALRSRRPADQATPPFGDRSPNFSVISLYSQTEERIAPLLRRAGNADELIELILGLEDMEVVEERNPAYP